MLGHANIQSTMVYAKRERGASRKYVENIWKREQKG